ncbi:MAG: hypothetical protein RIE86_01030, partial [Imperialibacter sp.]|uniref:hypothetical protein n=1 Tax=Imperialibacter sp. TaxID=2038411 RepID=UPI0032F04D88
DSVIAVSPPYMAVEGVIVTATFEDNSTRYTRDGYNSAQLVNNSNNIEAAIIYVKDKLKRGRPVIIGVHYTNGTSTPPNNNNRATRHFMIIVGIGTLDDKLYFRFYDPGRSLANAANATSPENILVVDKESGKVEGNYYNRTYSLTEIVKTY